VITLPQVYELAEMIGDWYAPDVIFLAVTGLRYGEYAALDDTDVDLKGARLRVSKSLDPWGNVNPPKTAAGDRVIDLHPPALEAVKAKRLLKLEHGLAASPALFPASRGGRADHGYFHRYEWKPSIAALGWKLKIHDLRHTAASLMIRFGANEFYVMEQLGHANIAVTMGVYTHLFREHKAEIRDRIDDAYREAMA
jgi:integrase